LSPDEIQALLDLQELDLKLIEYERHQTALPELIEEIEGPARKAGEQRERIAAELEHARVQQRHFEQELVANNEQFKKLQTQQMAIRNQIEYDAFNHELEALKDRADSLEESGLKWIERVEALTAQLPEAQEKEGVATERAAKLRGDLDKHPLELKRIHDEAAQLKAPLVDKISGQVLPYYRRLRQRGKAPFVAVINRGACGGCGFRHPPQRLQEIKQSRKMLSCEQCGRIQVWREEEAEKIGF
jgi:predicted  nucleic acid-binding Zn-ribbon protein